MGKVVGIDLGTTNSLVAYVRDGEPRVIRDSSGDALVPSVVSLGDEGTIFVGREAQRRLLTAPSRTVYSVKRFMGRGVEDVQGEASLLPFRVGGDAGRCRAHRPRRPRVHAAGDFRIRAARAEAARRRSLPRAGRIRLRGRSRGHYRARVLQRRAANRHPRRRTSGRTRGAAHHQRADGGVAGLRAGQEEPRHDRRLRPGRRHVRHLDPQGRGRRVPGAGDQWRYASRWRRHRSAARRARVEPDQRIYTRRVQKAGPALRCGVGAGDSQGRHSGQVGSLRSPRGRDSCRAVGRTSRRIPPRDHPRRVRDADSSARGSDTRPGAAGARRRRPRAARDRRGCSRRRRDADAAGAHARRRALREHAAQRSRIRTKSSRSARRCRPTSWSAAAARCCCST